MVSRAFAALAVLVAARASVAEDDRRSLLPVPAGDLALNSTEGWTRLRNASHAAPFATVAMHLETQRNQAFCSAATAATMLNALSSAGQAAPVDGFYAPHPYFTQRAIFESTCVNRVPSSDGSTTVSAKFVATHGATLHEWSSYISCFADARHVHAEDADAPAFRDQLRDAFSATPPRMVGLNFLRTSVGEVGGGHMSPVGAYDQNTDAVLIMDVSRYKYPPVWTPLETLFDAMLAVDDASGRSRGWVVVEPRSAASDEDDDDDDEDDEDDDDDRGDEGTRGDSSFDEARAAAAREACFATLLDPTDWDGVMACSRPPWTRVRDERDAAGGGGDVSAATAALTSALCLVAGGGLVGGAWYYADRLREAKFRRHVNLDENEFDDI